MNRRTFLRGMAGVGLVAAGVPVARNWPDDGVVNGCGRPDLPAALARHPGLTAALAGLDFTQVWDMHAHLTGVGDGASGIWVNPRMDSVAHPLELAQKAFYLNAACAAAGPGGVDQAYVARLVALAEAFPIGFRILLFAFDRFYATDGKAVAEATQFYVPNRYAAQIAARLPQRFAWAASVHPYRHDWEEELEFCLNNGAKAVKWLPPSMGIDPADPRCDRFYARLAASGLPLITHAGDELAARGGGRQDYGNPLRLRRALDHGVRVVVAHCASLGKGVDLDRGAQGPERENFVLFARMMGEPRFADRLFGDISAVTQVNRMSCLKTLLEREDWHPRLLNGSDYPLPGVRPLFSPRRIAAAGLLADGMAPLLSEIHRLNPLLFDFVLKRSLVWGGRKLPASVFETRKFFPADQSIPPISHRLNLETAVDRSIASLTS